MRENRVDRVRRRDVARPRALLHLGEGGLARLDRRVAQREVASVGAHGGELGGRRRARRDNVSGQVVVARDESEGGGVVP